MSDPSTVTKSHRVKDLKKDGRDQHRLVDEGPANDVVEEISSWDEVENEEGEGRMGGDDLMDGENVGVS